MNFENEVRYMKVTKKISGKVITETTGWFLMGLDGTLAKSQKTRTPIWWNDAASAQTAYNNGYGGEGATPVEILLIPDTWAYNGENADPTDLEAARQRLQENKTMRVTKKQLRRIIKEEKSKLLNENNPIANAEYLQGNYSDTVAIDAVGSALAELLAGTDSAALEDLQDQDDADDAAVASVTLAVANAFQSFGMIAQYDALIRTLR